MNMNVALSDIVTADSAENVVTIHLYMIKDDKADVWTAISNDVPIFTAEGKTYNDAIREAYLSASDLMEDDADYRDIKIIPQVITVKEAEREGIL